MKIDEFVKCVCRDLQGVTDYEKRRMAYLYRHFVRFEGTSIEFDIPLEPDGSGKGVVVAGATCREPVRLKFSLTFWGAFGNGPADGETETDTANG